MRRELLDLYNLAIERNGDNASTTAYREACKRIAPSIIIDEILKVDELEKQLADAKREAEHLAMSIWKKRYKETSPNFELCDTVAGVITQIDNMVSSPDTVDDWLESCPKPVISHVVSDYMRIRHIADTAYVYPEGMLIVMSIGTLKELIEKASWVNNLDDGATLARCLKHHEYLTRELSLQLSTGIGNYNRDNGRMLDNVTHWDVAEDFSYITFYGDDGTGRPDYEDIPMKYFIRE